ncbi:MAG: type II toxin-antitoxin system VapC family toxin [Anaerolineales bacterium]|nr:type II toxin-antitoxin system VapC family toxin [Anaerolineales bacterium]
MIVADTNLIVYLFINGDQTELAQRVLSKDPQWIVPPLWQSEFLNVLAAHIRRDMPVQKAKQLMDIALQALKRRQIIPSHDMIIELVSESDCTAYDCEFVALARQLEIKLVTADKQLLKRFPDYAVSLEEFTK